MRFEHAGRRYEVSVRETGDGLEVAVDGSKRTLRVREIAPATFVLATRERAVEFHCVRAGDEFQLWWDGRVYKIALEREGGRSADRHAPGDLETPMPGKVIKVSVNAGQPVKKGDEILVVEAMKMENAIRAPKDGVVKSLAAKAGDLVSPGTTLAEIE